MARRQRGRPPAHALSVDDLVELGVARGDESDHVVEGVADGVSSSRT
jgi:hypothetical protein